MTAVEARPRPAIVIPVRKAARPGPISRNPTVSKLRTASGMMRGMKTVDSTMPSTAIGMLIQKIQRQSK